MNTQDIKVFDIDECIKTFRKTYKVPKKKKDTIINYIFNIYFVLKNNNDNSRKGCNNITKGITEPSSKDKLNTNQIQQNISIQLDSKGLKQLLSYINMIPEKYHLETKKSKGRKNSSSSQNNTLVISNKITNNIDTSQVLQLENTQYPLLTYENSDINSSNKNNTNQHKSIQSDTADTNTADTINTNTVNTNIDNKTNNKKKNQCMGRTAKHTRCSRSCKAGYEYCQSHINNKCPFGRFDEELKIPEEKIIKKRGRKRKVEISNKFKNEDYITLWPEIVDGDKRLVDRFNNIYSFDLDKPKFLGVKQLDGKIDTSSPLLTSVF